MSPTKVLADRDVNTSAVQQPAVTGADGKDIKSMDYHRQLFQNKIQLDQAQQSYVSPSDNIMSPCTAKLSAYRSKTALKAKPKSLFAKTSSKNIDTANMFGDFAGEKSSTS